MAAASTAAEDVLAVLDPQDVADDSSVCQEGTLHCELCGETPVQASCGA